MFMLQALERLEGKNYMTNQDRMAQHDRIGLVETTPI